MGTLMTGEKPPQYEPPKEPEPQPHAKAEEIVLLPSPEFFIEHTLGCMNFATNANGFSIHIDDPRDLERLVVLTRLLHQGAEITRLKLFSKFSSGIHVEYQAMEALDGIIEALGEDRALTSLTLTKLSGMEDLLKAVFRPHGPGRRLHIIGIEITYMTAKIIAAAVSRGSILTLDIQDCVIGDEGAKELSCAMKSPDVRVQKVCVSLSETRLEVTTELIRSMLECRSVQRAGVGVRLGNVKQAGVMGDMLAGYRKLVELRADISQNFQHDGTLTVVRIMAGRSRNFLEKLYMKGGDPGERERVGKALYECPNMREADAGAGCQLSKGVEELRKKGCAIARYDPFLYRNVLRGYES